MNFEPISPINIEIPKFDNDGITRQKTKINYYILSHFGLWKFLA